MHYSLGFVGFLKNIIWFSFMQIVSVTNSETFETNNNHAKNLTPFDIFLKLYEPLELIVLKRIVRYNISSVQLKDANTFQVVWLVERDSERAWNYIFKQHNVYTKAKSRLLTTMGPRLLYITARGSGVLMLFAPWITHVKKVTVCCKTVPVDMCPHCVWDQSAWHSFASIFFLFIRETPL